jgi:hypothetical protein
MSPKTHADFFRYVKKTTCWKITEATSDGTFGFITDDGTHSKTPYFFIGENTIFSIAVDLGAIGTSRAESEGAL